jgi:hypothetical protein
MTRNNPAQKRVQINSPPYKGGVPRLCEAGWFFLDEIGRLRVHASLIVRGFAQQGGSFLTRSEDVQYALPFMPEALPGGVVLS